MFRIHPRQRVANLHKFELQRIQAVLRRFRESHGICRIGAPFYCTVLLARKYQLYHNRRQLEGSKNNFSCT
jgi:hypothetical protein